MSHLTRRDLLKSAAAGAVLAPTVTAMAQDDMIALPIVDTHQHLWDLDKQRLPWLSGAPEVLRKTYWTKEYADATSGLNVIKAIYMEVDVAPEQHVEEAERVVGLTSKEGATCAAVIGGRPASPGFAAYLDRFAKTPEVKGVRQVLHSADTPAGYCLQPEFLAGVRELGKRGLRFDICIRPGELGDAVKLVKECPDTKFVVDHCGNGDPAAFAKGPGKKPHDPDDWKRNISALAKAPNTIIKISGVVAKAPKDFTPDDLAPVINPCLDAFGPDRVIFGGDWPVCLLGASYRGWVEALRAIVSNRPLEHRKKLFSENAIRFYAV